jgi:hypothetical protein
MGSLGSRLGAIGISTTKLSMEEVNNIENDRNTGSGEGGLNDQGFFTDLGDSSVLQIASHEFTGSAGVSTLGSGLSHSASIADQVGSDGYTSLSTYGHAIQPQDDSLLLQGQNTTLIHVVMNKDIALHSEIADGRASIDGLAIPRSITDFNICGDFPTQGSDGAVTDLEILKLEELSLQSFETLPRFAREFKRFIEPCFFAGVAPVLGHSKDQQNQNALQHESSVNSSSATLSRHRWLVKK